MSRNPTKEELRRIYEESRTIAVVGASPDESKRSNIVPGYLQENGYRIVPVNPHRRSILGEHTYPTLADIPEPVDVVEVFRPAEEAPDIARQAVAIGAKVLWLQKGILSEEAREIAGEAGMTYVEDLCMAMVHVMLDLGPGPDA